jgi:hypothetical protein
MASILDIDDDAMAVIVSFIEDPEAYLAIRLVCRKFYELSKQVDGTILTKFSRPRDIHRTSFRPLRIRNHCDMSITATESGLLWRNRLKHGTVMVECCRELDGLSSICMIKEKYIVGYLMSSWIISSDGVARLFKRIKTRNEYKQYQGMPDYHMTMFLLNCKGRLDDMTYDLFFNTANINMLKEAVITDGGCVIAILEPFNAKYHSSKSILHHGTTEVFKYYENGKLFSHEQNSSRKYTRILWRPDGTILSKKKLIFNATEYLRREHIKYSPSGNITFHSYYVRGLEVIKIGKK